MKTTLKNVYLNDEVVDILISDGIIEKIESNLPDSGDLINGNGHIVIPGMIDPHTHIRDMELAYKEDWESASNAALAGGVTTIFDMPNTKPATINLDGFKKKIEAAKKSTVHHKFFIGATNHNLRDVEEILKGDQAENAAGIKIFMASSSANEVVEDPGILKAFFELAKSYDKVVAVHSEDQSCILEHEQNFSANDPLLHNKIRNRKCAAISTEILLKLADEVGHKLYIVHTSTWEEIDMIRQYKRHKSNVYCEISPHHLLINESLMEKVGNFGKVNPPLRTALDNEKLWEGIHDGTVDSFGSDHAPHGLDEKKLPYLEAPSGFPGLETSLPLLLNEVNKGRLSLKKLTELCSTNPSKIFNLYKRGQVAEGYMADLAIIDMGRLWQIDPTDFYTKAKYSPYAGMSGRGNVIMTLVAGKLKYNIDDKAAVYS